MLGFRKLEKQTVDLEVLAEAVAKAENKQIVKVTVPAKRRGPKPADPDAKYISFEMYKEVPVAAYSHFMGVIIDMALKSSDATGVYGIDYTTLYVGVHSYIIENLTSLPLPGVNGENSLDIDTILAYGHYLVDNCSTYAAVYTDLINHAEKELPKYVIAMNQMAVTMISNTDFEKLLSNPAIMQGVQSMFSTFGDYLG